MSYQSVINDLDQMSLAYMDELVSPEKGWKGDLLRETLAPAVEERPRGKPGRSPMTPQEARASLARYAADRGTRGVRKAYAALGDDTTFSRFVRIPGFVPQHSAKQLAMDSRYPAFMEGRSIFSTKGVKPLGELTNLLVSGHNNVKIGRDVRKGRFKGYWIYTLSLEERATCPRSCAHWTDCYGNNMPYAKRVDHSDRGALETRLADELERLLLVKGRTGVLVRLHALGDFFHVRYVAFWKEMLRKYPNLAVYGYTARKPDSAIGQSITQGKEEFGRRFAIRWSDGGLERDCTVSIGAPESCPPTAFVCPEQTHRSDGCGKCGACWTGDKDVAFITH